MKVLVTGGVGFIGMHTCKALLLRGVDVLCLDNMNDYYDVGLKQSRLRELMVFSSFKFIQLDVSDESALNKIFLDFKPDFVIHLAAQAGVRYSIVNPQSYITSNINGFMNILECVRRCPVKHLVYASSSSVYGGRDSMPFKETDNVDHPVSLYAATKKANELMAHSYSHLFSIPSTGLRFFTVYGPWGRPDMSPMLFISAILSGKPINIFNNGQMKRDFTYVDDIVEGILRVLEVPFSSSGRGECNTVITHPKNTMYRILNIGNSEPVSLMNYIAEIEEALGVKAIRNYLPMQPGDVVATYADTSELERLTGFSPKTSLKEGIQRMVDWYRSYYIAR